MDFLSVITSTAAGRQRLKELDSMANTYDEVRAAERSQVEAGRLGLSFWTVANWQQACNGNIPLFEALCFLYRAYGPSAEFDSIILALWEAQNAP